MDDIIRPQTWNFYIKEAGRTLISPFSSFFAVHDDFRDKLRVHLEDVFVDIGFDKLGVHQYISMKDAFDNYGSSFSVTTIPIYSEENVPLNRKVVTALDNESSKHYYGFNVVDDLSLWEGEEEEGERGIQPCLFLISDAKSLMWDREEEREGKGEGEGEGERSLPANVSLIVNCQENSPKKERYKVPCRRLMGIAVHNLAYNRNDRLVCERLYQLNEAIWEEIHHGSVIVHCNAGEHRASAIVVTQYLFRRYSLGHTHFADSYTVLYQNLKAIRPGVDPLYAFVVVKFIGYLRAAFPHITKEVKDPRKIENDEEASQKSPV